MIILAGNVGSGKTEQGHRLAARLGCPWLSTGQLLRDNPNNARLVKMVSGQLVDDQDIINILETKLAELGSSEFVLDGAPRSLNQAQWLVDKITAGQVKLTAVLHLNVPQDEVMRRLANRQRTDDDKHIVETRLEEYENTTKPALAYLAEHGVRVQEIDGLGGVEEVEARIDQALGTKS